jgi:hypothetical protein
MILKWIFRRPVRCMDWIGLAQDKDNWRAFVKTVLQFRIKENGECFLA